MSLLKRKGNALSCGNYRGLKLQKHVMKILEHIFNTTYRKKSLSITCSLVSCQVGVPLIQFSYLGSHKKSTCKRRKTSTLHLST